MNPSQSFCRRAAGAVVALVAVAFALNARAIDTNLLFQSSTVGVGTNTALKGIAIRLAGNAAVCFDTELMRMSGGWVGGFVPPVKLMSRGEFPMSQGEIAFVAPVLPGWCVRGDENKDPRAKQIGPLPATWAKWRGLYVHGDKVVLSYTVGDCEILEMSEYDAAAGEFVRAFNLGPSSRPLSLLLGSSENKPFSAQVETVGKIDTASGSKASSSMHGNEWISFSAHKSPIKFRIRIKAKPAGGGSSAGVAWVNAATPIADLKSFTTGGPARYPQPVETKGELGLNTRAYTVDTLTVPYENPWSAEMFLAGVDFFSDGKRAAVCTFHGDVWVVSGIDGSLAKLSWRRYASGLYHALGLKIVKDQIYVLGRDQITRLHDLNGDGEADFYENFNNDCFITTNFHEFAFDLHTDEHGNFYFTKAGPVRNGGRGFAEIADHHGAMFKVSPDGKKFEVVATGFRAPNGMGVGPHGELTSGDNEGTWTPMCRLNWIKPGGFYGVVPLAHRAETPTDYDKPICWFPKNVDNSSGGQVWVTTDQWGPFSGHMLHLSYGTCSLFHVLKEEVDGQVQGGVVRFPLSFNSGIMRARFNAVDHQLYLVGMKGWQTSAAKNGGFQRVRFTGQPVCMPLEMHARKNGMEITFTTPLDPASANDLENYSLEQWNYVWSSAYGSPEISALAPAPIPSDKGGTEWAKTQKEVQQHDPVTLKSAKLSADGRTLFLEIPDLKPVMQMKIKYQLKSAAGADAEQEIYQTINKLPR